MRALSILAPLVILAATQPALAAKKAATPPVTLNACTQSYGAIAVVDGDTQGWTKYGLGSPRELINALALESKCFTVADPASGKPATFLMNVIAGDKEEIDRGVQVASSAAKEGLARAGVGGLGGKALGGMLGGFGGKKKTLAAGIRLISPASGQTLVTGSGDVAKTTITFGGAEGFLGQGGASSGYASSKDGKMLVEAFIKAFNAVTGQGAALATFAPQGAVNATN